MSLQTNTLPYKEATAKIIAAFSAQQFSEAEHLATALLQEYNDDMQLIRLLAEALYRQGKASEAIAKMQILIQLDMDNAAHYNDMGAMQASTKQYTAAENSYRIALALDPKEHNARYNLAVSLYHQQRFLDAQTVLNELAAIAPNYPNIDTLQQQIKEGIMSQTQAALPAEALAKPTPYIPWQAGETIRVAFIVQYPAVWPSMRSAYLAASKDPRFLTQVILTPFVHHLSSSALNYDNMKQCLLDENIPFCPADYFDIATFKPHITFVQNPYEATRPQALRSDALSAAGTRLAYIPYGLETGGGAWNFNAQFDAPLHRTAWRIFARSERHQKMFAHHCQAGNAHVVVTGHPKLDLAAEPSQQVVPPALTQKIKGRKVILWTPHFSVSNPPTWSSYLFFNETILKEINNHPELFLLIRPHPLFFKSMQQNGLWNAQGENAFRNYIAASDNIALDDSTDYGMVFAISHALMTDVGSFLLEYLPTEKPLLYLHCPDGLGMNDDAALIDYLYTAYEHADIGRFMAMIGEGKDPKQEERKAAVPTFLFHQDRQAGQRICEALYAGIKAEGNATSVRTKRADAPQLYLEQYWKSANTSYLAPASFYAQKEAHLATLLQQLPPLKRAIDIGCADGRFTLQIAPFVKEIIAYDISQQFIAQAQKASLAQQIKHAQFVVSPIEHIYPCEKYDLVVCMGVTSCLMDDLQFLHLLDLFRQLCHPKAYLLLGDTLSLNADQMHHDEHGYLAKYRSLSAYQTLVERRGFHLKETRIVSELVEHGLTNQLFLFKLSA